MLAELENFVGGPGSRVFQELQALEYAGAAARSSLSQEVQEQPQRHQSVPEQRYRRSRSRSRERHRHSHRH